MKKIVFAVTTDLNYDQRMQRICTSLAKNGYEVLLIGRTWTTSIPLTQQLYKQHRINCFYSKGKLFYLEYTIRLFWYLLFVRANAYCAIDLDTILPVFIKAKLSRKYFIYDAHEYFSEVIEVVDRPIIKKIWLTLESFMVPRTDLAYTVTDSLAKLYYNKYHVKFSVIRNCSVLQKKEPICLPQKEKYIIYQGAVNAGRGLEYLVYAMKQIEIPLIICGQGEIYEDLQKMTLSLQLADKIQFNGYMVPEALKDLTRKAYLGINLLENKGLNYFYSLGNKFFDYIEAGIPQLIVDFPEYQLLNSKYRVAEVVTLDPEEIAATVNNLLNQPNHYQEMVHNCLLAREELSWEKEEKKLLTYYSELWEKPNR